MSRYHVFFRSGLRRIVEVDDKLDLIEKFYEKLDAAYSNGIRDVAYMRVQKTDEQDVMIDCFEVECIEEV